MNANGDFCRAVSQAGAELTVFLPGVTVAALAAVAKGGEFICTQHPDHRGNHTSCDGRGHVLASWPRQRPERYWHREDCAGCAHHKRAAAVWN